jgi:hydroxypyruvate isomerase
MRFSAHLGYHQPGGAAQFAQTIGSSSISKLADHAASIGMAGVLYPWALVRPPREIAALAAALQSNRLKCSCVGLPPQIINAGAWVDRSIGGKAHLKNVIDRGADTAALLGSSTLGIFIGGRGFSSGEDDLTAAADNIDEIACLVADRPLTIAIEPLSVFPNSLLRRVDEAGRFVRALGRANVKLIFDTAHVAREGDDIIQVFKKWFDEIELLQLADMPGRVEPGAGVLDLVGLSATAIELGYSGLVDLEHSWQCPGRAGEVLGLERLRAFDASIRFRRSHYELQ